MKIKLHITILIAVAFLLPTACLDDLDIVQPSTFTSNSMWQEEGDFTSIVNGMYAIFRSGTADNLNIWGDLRSGCYGDAILNSYANAVRNNVLVEDSEGTNWQPLYTTINYANLILKHIDDIAWSKETTRNEIVANAYFIRAWCYFQIVRLWGDAPLLTAGFESTDYDLMYPSRGPAADIYTLVESDITAAGSLLTSGTSRHQASPAAINMLKAEFYPWKAKQLSGGTDALNAAKTAIDAVLNNTSYTFASDYAALFGCSTNNNKPTLSASQLETKETNTEFIWSIPYSQTEYTGSYLAYIGVNIANALDNLENNPVPIGTHAQYLSLTRNFVTWLGNELPAGVTVDKRHAINWLYMTSAENGNLDEIRVIRKFSGEWTNSTRYFTNDIPMYRLAEAYLLKAEAENALGNASGALTYLNKVAYRAYGVNCYTTTVKAEIDEAIVDEYLREFILENKFWWVFRRFGVCFNRVAALAGEENTTNILLWPIASACRTTNPNIEQTEGY